MSLQNNLFIVFLKAEKTDRGLLSAWGHNLSIQHSKGTTTSVLQGLVRLLPVKLKFTETTSWNRPTLREVFRAGDTKTSSLSPGSQMLKAARHSAYPEPQRSWHQSDGDKSSWKPPQNGKWDSFVQVVQPGEEICCSALNGTWITMENLGQNCIQSAFFKANTIKKWNQESHLHINSIHQHHFLPL